MTGILMERVQHYDYIMGYNDDEDDDAWSASSSAELFHPDNIKIFREHETWRTSN